MRYMHYAKTVPDAELNTKERSIVKDFMNVKQNLSLYYRSKAKG